MYKKLDFSQTALLIVGVLLFVSGLLIPVLQAQESPPDPDAIANPIEVAEASAVWEQSGHAQTFDNGLGADTTCARCKSPLNWDPTAPAAEAALDCASCKRIPGEERPILEGSIPVAESEWQNIGCPICHEPVGDSYRIAPSFWNQELGVYEPVESGNELCAHCHEGQHGFEVVEEMQEDLAHPGWGCLDCHGPHGDSIECIDCHDDLATKPGAQEHADHQEVTCSACHDQGGLALWRERDSNSSFYGEVVTIRFAHTLTSWPSHNLRTEVECGRCHHAASLYRAPIADSVSCNNGACHPQGAVLHWCPLFEKDVP